VAGKGVVSSRIRDALRLAPGPVELSDYGTSSRPCKRDKRDRRDEMRDMQERLWAESTAGGRRSVLLVLQGMDTAGKGGVTEHVVGAFGPIGVQYTAFKRPTDEELAHGFLWRIRNRLPTPGVIGVFDRSHYEDVLITRVHGLITTDEAHRRFEQINAFEQELVAAGTTVLKCFLHISYDTQRERLLARLDNPDKHWKFNEADIDERAHWDDYQAAYADALEHCNTPEAPWYVIPSDRKRYRNWLVGELMREVLEELDPQYPRPHLDVPALKARLVPPN
jgi:PPK2 family polyphosphate:nucleotide phosphotransferase